MKDDPRGDGITRQYERWMYPFPISDLEGWLLDNWEWFDPSHAHRILWPDRPYAADMDILISGCGTNQAAVFAFTNPGARVVAIDVSRSALDHHEHLKHRYALTNLSLHRLPIEEAPALGLDFDLVVSTGVLHHLADPPAGLRALAACARPDAALAIMVYARYGRLGVEMLASVFRDMGLQQDDMSIALVRETLSMLPANHPVRSYLGITTDLGSDAALVDTFLNARERSYTVEDCLDLVGSAGLVFQSWLFNAPYHLHNSPSVPKGILSAIHALPETRHWSVMERLHSSNACHFFVACRPERPRASYAVDFEADTFVDLVPQMRKACGLSGSELYRPDWRLVLDPTQLLFVEQVDGRRTIGEITAAVARSPAWPGASDLRELSRELFQALWRLDFLAVALDPGS